MCRSGEGAAARSEGGLVEGSTRLAVEGTGLIAGDVEFDVFLVDPFVSVDSVLFRIIPHRMVPPIEEGIHFRLVHRITEIAPRILLNRSAGYIIDLSVAFQRKQHQKQPGFMIVQFINAGAHIRFGGKHLFRPHLRRRQNHTENEKKDGSALPNRHGSRSHRSHANRLDATMPAGSLQP